MGVYTPDLPLVLCHIFRLLASGEIHRYSGKFCRIFYGGMYTICRHLRIVLRRFCLRLPGPKIDFAPVICVAVGASIARPQNLTLPPNSPGGYRIRPYANQNLAPEGSIGEGQKSVKKSAALLRFLAFLALDHPFGVPRGEQPLGRGPLPRNSGTFFVSFFGHKKGKSCGRSPLKRGGRRRVAAPGSHTHPSPKIKPLL